MCFVFSELQRRVEASVQAEHDSQGICCLVCGCTWDQESLAAHITYHGEDGPKDADCPECEAELTVTEYVVRTFEVTARVGGE